MPKTTCSQYVARKGGELLSYKEACRAVVRLPGGQRVAITMGPNRAEMRQCYKYFGMLLTLRPMVSIDLNGMLHDNPSDARATFNHATILDTLIKRISSCRSLGDVLVKASTGALDPFQHDD